MSGPDDEVRRVAAQLLLEQLGFDPADLNFRRTTDLQTPTFNEYIPVVRAAVSEATRRTYDPYWNKIQVHWGDLPLTKPSPSEIKHLAAIVKSTVVIRRNSKNGRSAMEHFISALRCIYTHALDDTLIDKEQDPSQKVSKPRRLPSNRYALPPHRLAEINRIAGTTGNDPELDRLILRFHTETAARRGGALSVQYPEDVDVEQCLVRLHEKGDTVRWQPVSPTLMTHLLAHARLRPAPEGTQLLRYEKGKPITARRYDYIWTRVGSHLPWVVAQDVSTHWLRYATLTWVERHFGYAVARAYAGHMDQAGSTGSTATYVKAGMHEVALALEVMSGEQHPLAIRHDLVHLPGL